MSRLARALTRMIGAALLGLGTIFAPKANLDDHWSTPVTRVLRAVAGPETPSGRGAARPEASAA